MDTEILRMFFKTALLFLCGFDIIASMTNRDLEERKMLQTKRLYLRNFRQSDLGTMFDYRNDTRCNLYQRYEDTSKEYLQKFIQDYAKSTFISKEKEQHYAIVCDKNNEMIGDISMFYSESDNCFTLGITIAPIFQGQGYAYEILDELVKKIQNDFPSTDIVALIDKDNSKSISLFRKLNFVEECYAESIQSYIFTIYGKAD